MTKTVVILLSDKRSGSTMLQRELCSHPDIQTVAYSPHTYLETHHWLEAAVMLGIDPALFSGGKVYRGYGSRQNARTYMEDCIQKNVPECGTLKKDRDLVFEGWEALCQQFAQPIFFEKSPQLLAHWGGLELLLEWIDQTDFQVKVIGLVRNPLSVMYSAQALFHTDPQKREPGWVEMHQNLLRVQAQLGPKRFRLYRYEDIIQQPVEVLAEVCTFIGVSPSAMMGKKVHASSMNKWASDPFFTFQLSDSAIDMAQQLNYKKDQLRNPDKPAPSWVYRVRRKVIGQCKLAIYRFKSRFVTPLRLRLKQKRAT